MRGVKRSTAERNGFFPAGWTAAQIANAIAEAMDDRQPFDAGEAGNFFEGRTREGMRLILQLDDGRVLDAIPQRAKLNKGREAKFQIERGIIPNSRRVCRQCKKIKVRVCPSGHGLPRPIGVGGYVERVLTGTIRRVLAKVLPKG